MTSEAPEVVLHVGLHKTGSSFLQRALLTVREELGQRGVLLRARDDLYDDPDFRPIIRRFHAGGVPEPERLADVTKRANALMHEPGFGHVVFSDEAVLATFPDFSKPGLAYGNGIPALRWLVESVAHPSPVRVIMYVRRQDRFIESAYMQLIHQGSTETFADWFETIDVRRFDWLELSRQIEDVVGTGRLVIRPYETIAHGVVEYFTTFLRTIDPEIVISVPQARLEKLASGANRSFSAKAHEIARRVYPLLTREERSKLRKFLQMNFSNRDYPRAEFFTAEESDGILEIHRSGNAKLFDLYMPDCDPDALGYM